MMLCSDEIFWGKMPLVVMKFVGAKYGNKNVKIILVEKMMLCNDEIFWGKIVSGNPPVPITTILHGIIVPVILGLFSRSPSSSSSGWLLRSCLPARTMAVKLSYRVDAGRSPGILGLGLGIIRKYIFPNTNGNFLVGNEHEHEKNIGKGRLAIFHPGEWKMEKMKRAL